MYSKTFIFSTYVTVVAKITAEVETQRSEMRQLSGKIETKLVCLSMTKRHQRILNSGNVFVSETCRKYNSNEAQQRFVWLVLY